MSQQYPRPSRPGSVLSWSGTAFEWIAPLAPGLVLTADTDRTVMWAVPSGGGGGGGTMNHASLTSGLSWTTSGHTGTANRIAGFSGAGAATTYQIGADLQAWDADLDALAALASTGVAVRTGAGTWTVRTVTGTTDEITVGNGTGVGGNPTSGLASNPTVPGTGGMVLPIGTTAQRGASTAGRIRANTTLVALEYHDGSGWVIVAPTTYVDSVRQEARRLALFGGL